MDITDRIAEPPKWWVQGIPRYCDYHPKEATGKPIEILVRVGCQGCWREFDIAVGTDKALGPALTDLATGQDLWDACENPPFHLGDNGYNCAGNSCGILPREVLQVWSKTGLLKWDRRGEIEGPVTRW